MKIYYLIICLSIIVTSLYGDKFKVYNETDFDIGIAIYYVKRSGNRVTHIEIIPAHDMGILERPKRKSGYDRQIVFSFVPEDLHAYLSEDRLSIMGNTNVGDIQGSEVHIALTKGHLEGYNFFEWKIIHPTKTQVKRGLSALDELTWGKLRAMLILHKFGTKVAYVRQGKGLSNDELQYLQKRDTKSALERFIGTRLENNQVPRIAICASGGGYRAMLNVLGALLGAEAIGLLSCTTYISALSGSTWALAPWIQTNTNLQQFKTSLIPRLRNNFFNIGTNINALAIQLLIKLSFGQPISLVDVYGTLLASNLLGSGDPNQYSLYQQRFSIEDGHLPFPIYTAIATKLPYEWVEFNPYEFGSDYLGGYIPIWSFGRKFLNGVSKDFAPPTGLGFMMGIWGSAFAANFKEMLNEFKETIKPDFLKAALIYGTNETVIGRQRALPAQIFNYTYGMMQSPRRQQEYLTLVDAGIDFNLPIPPLMKRERKVDIIIVLDASANVDIAPGSELRKAEDYCSRNGLKFPIIDYDRLDKQHCSVWDDPEDPEVPTVIYMPQIKNSNYSESFDPAKCIPTFCGTFNFIYKPEEIESLVGLSQYTMQSCRNTIIEAIRRKIELKSNEY